MTNFTCDLDVRRSGRLWTLLAPLEYAMGEEESPYVIRVPAYFQTDFASVPRLLWWLISPTDPGVGKAAVLHDYLYREGFLGRRMADAIMVEAMRVLGVPAWKRGAIYLALRLFGWVAWREHRRLA